MPKYRVPSNELRAIYDPLDGVRWGCGPITVADIEETAQAGVLEHRSWQEVNGPDLSPEENRTFHLRRLATLCAAAILNPDPEPEPADRRIRFSMVLAGAGVVQNAWYVDGNHRVGVAFLLGTEHIELDIIGDEDLLPTVLPSAVLIDDTPAAAAQDDQAAPEQNAAAANALAPDAAG